ncbi:MAG: hypothetical protein H6518_06415 [Microthrixaceae bacterium]|nr:hypothetical protein [Microthrixaceae bacterium]
MGTVTNGRRSARRGRLGGAAAPVLVAVLVLAGLVPPGPAAARPEPPPPGIEPIVFVHGLHDSTAAFATMVQRFRDAGVPEDRLWPWGYDSRKSNVDSAADFAAFVTGVRLETGATHVDVVAHSMGALPTRWCIRFGPCRRVVDDWVSLAGPNHGTNITITCLLFPGEEGCPEMAVGSSFLAQLNAGDETPGQVDWTTIRSTTDQIITPSASTELDGAVNVVYDGLAHNDLLSDPSVFAKVAAVLADGGDPAAPAAPGAVAGPAAGAVEAVEAVEAASRRPRRPRSSHPPWGLRRAARRRPRRTGSADGAGRRAAARSSWSSTPSPTPDATSASPCVGGACSAAGRSTWTTTGTRAGTGGPSGRGSPRVGGS